MQNKYKMIIMENSEVKQKIEKAFKEKLKEQISDKGELLMSGIPVKIVKVGKLSATIQPGGLDLNQLVFHGSTNVYLAGTIEVFIEDELKNVQPSEFYNFQVIGIKVTFKSEEKVFEFENEITLSNFNKR